jgi:hypothetical protein
MSALYGPVPPSSTIFDFVVSGATGPVAHAVNTAAARMVSNLAFILIMGCFRQI